MHLADLLGPEDGREKPTDAAAKSLKYSIRALSILMDDPSCGVPCQSEDSTKALQTLGSQS